MQKRILILGHTGFIGSHLTNTFLKNDWEVIGVSSRKPEPVVHGLRLTNCQADLKTDAGLKTLKQIIETQDCNIVVNLVWDVSANCHSSLTSIDSLYDTTRIARVFVEAKVSGKKEFICAGTNAEYKPNCSDYAPLVETAESVIKPDSIYGVCKAAGFKVLSKMCEDNDIAFKWPRIFSTFGAGMRPTCFMPALIKALKTGEIYTIKNGLTVVHFTPVEFVADAIFQLIDKHPGETLGAVNVATDKGTSVNEVATILINSMTNPRDAVVEIHRTVKTEQIPSLYKLDTLIDTIRMHVDVTSYIKSMMQLF